MRFWLPSQSRRSGSSCPAQINCTSPVVRSRMPSSMVTLMASLLSLSSSLLMASAMPVGPDGMAEAINRELLKDNSEAMSVTMLLGILDLTTGEVQLICAGHEDPLLLDCDGNQKRIKLDGGPPFSVAEFPY